MNWISLKKLISLKSSHKLTEIQEKHKYINIYKYLYIDICIDIKYIYIYIYIYYIYIYIYIYILYIYIYIYINILTQIIQVIFYFISSAAPSNISAPILRATPQHVWRFLFIVSKPLPRKLLLILSPSIFGQISYFLWIMTNLEKQENVLCIN